MKIACTLRITYSSASTKTANSHIKDNNKLHIWPDPHAVYVPGASLKIEGILFQELPTKIDENRW